MSNDAMFVAYAPFVLCTGVVLFASLGGHRPWQASKDFVLAALMGLGWQLVSLLYFVVPGEAATILLHNMHLPFVSFSTLFLLFFVIRFYHLEGYMFRSQVLLMWVIPCITTVICLTSHHHNFLYEELEVVAYHPLKLTHQVPGNWYYIHIFYCYLLLAVALCVALTQHAKIPKGFRVCSSLLLVSMLVAIVSNAITLLFLMDTPLDLSIVGVSVSLSLMLVSINNNQRMDYLMLARTEIFNYQTQAIFILDKESVVLETNRRAKELVEQLGISTRGLTRQELKNALRRRGAIYHHVTEEGEGTDITLDKFPAERTYNVREWDIKNKAGDKLGSFMAVQNVTRNRRLISMLNETAGIDPLTGLPNRRKFELLRESYSLSGVLPLAVIMGDVNGLKQVNDELGHEYGDQLLEVVAEVLSHCVQPVGQVFRLGGDEFLLLLPNTGRERAEQVMHDIHARLDASNQFPFRASISLGCQVRTQPEEPLSDIMALADKHMYARKQTLRVHR